MTRLSVSLLALAACAEPGTPDVRIGSTCAATVLREVNDHWIATHPDPGNNKWARAVYFTGNSAAYETLGEPAYLDYARAWANQHDWRVNGPTTTRHADNHAAGQTYLALYKEDPDPIRIADIRLSIDHVIDSREIADWSWIDAIFMAAPVFAELGAISGEPRYVDAMFAMYEDAKLRRGLFDAATGLWFRDGNYVYPDATTENGKKIFWSRGNGWVIASLVRMLERLPADSPYRAELVTMLETMAAALVAVQRDDGFWSVSLHDPDEHGGPESSGTALFTYAIAWGIHEGILDRAAYLPVVERAWGALVTQALHAGGGVGWVQGVGENPGSEQPVELASTADFGVGAFLLAASTVDRVSMGHDCPSPGGGSRPDRSRVGLRAGSPKHLASHHRP